MKTGIVIALILMGIATYFDVAKALGAHPFWSQQVMLIGLGIGIIATLITRGRGFIFFALLLGIAALISWQGKTRFAASYAEDALAGQLWHYGWIAIAAAATATLITLWTQHVSKT
jgi:hypothetical protein